MEKRNKTGGNFALFALAIIIGVTLFKHIDFVNFKTEQPALDLVYFLALFAIIYLLKRRLSKRENQEDE